MSGDNDNSGPFDAELLGAIETLDRALQAFLHFAESLPATKVGAFAEEAARFRGEIMAHLADITEQDNP